MNDLVSKLNNAIGSGNEKKFLELIQDMTVLQFAVLDRENKLHSDWAYLIWRNSRSYGFNISWACLSMQTSEEIENEIAIELERDQDFWDDPEFVRGNYAIPTNFNPNTKFSQLNINALV